MPEQRCDVLPLELDLNQVIVEKLSYLYHKLVSREIKGEFLVELVGFDSQLIRVKMNQTERRGPTKQSDMGKLLAYLKSTPPELEGSSTPSKAVQPVMLRGALDEMMSEVDYKCQRIYDSFQQSERQIERGFHACLFSSEKHVKAVRDLQVCRVILAKDLEKVSRYINKEFVNTLNCKLESAEESLIFNPYFHTFLILLSSAENNLKVAEKTTKEVQTFCGKAMEVVIGELIGFAKQLICFARQAMVLYLSCLDQYGGHDIEIFTGLVKAFGLLNGEYEEKERNFKLGALCYKIQAESKKFLEIEKENIFKHLLNLNGLEKFLFDAQSKEDISETMFAEVDLLIKSIREDLGFDYKNYTKMCQLSNEDFESGLGLDFSKPQSACVLALSSVATVVEKPEPDVGVSKTPYIGKSKKKKPKKKKKAASVGSANAAGAEVQKKEASRATLSRDDLALRSVKEVAPSEVDEFQSVSGLGSATTRNQGLTEQWNEFLQRPDIDCDAFKRFQETLFNQYYGRMVLKGKANDTVLKAYVDQSWRLERKPENFVLLPIKNREVKAQFQALCETLSINSEQITVYYGSGGLNDALLHEAETGQDLSEHGHITKGLAWFNRLKLKLESGHFNSKGSEMLCREFMEDLKTSIEHYKACQPDHYAGALKTVHFHGCLKFTIE